jgi:hypothetical protein
MREPVTVTALPLFGQSYIEEIRQNLNRSHRAWSFQGKKSRHFAYIDLAQDAHGGWWAAWHWSIHTIPDSYTGTIGGGGPKDYAGRSKHRALIDALNAIISRLPESNCGAGKEFNAIRLAARGALGDALRARFAEIERKEAA